MLPVPGVDHTYLPVLIDKSKEEDLQIFNDLIASNAGITILDQFSSQKKELFKIKNPRKVLSGEDLDRRYADWEKDKNTDHEGIWVYYPWSKRLIHILDKEEFITLRTIRNHYKISPEEQRKLGKKKVGIIGLSVGSAIALSIATERAAGKLKLADFDTVELSNLNRLKTGLHNIGLNKCIITAREIFEIDPFLEIECYPEGLTEDNIHHFLTGDGNLDLLIDECDDLSLKILCRNLSKKYAIPVLMETSDRGMLDVERFDLDPDRPILHGFLADIPEEKLRNITPEFRFPLVMRIVDVMNSSTGLRTSLMEMGQTVSTWPQLASAVTLGGAVVTDVTRRIFLGKLTSSGRFYVDLEKIIQNQPLEKALSETPQGRKFDLNEANRIADSLVFSNITTAPPVEHIMEIVKAGSQAPSSGNNQPWKWLFRNSRLFLFHDTSRSSSFSNFENSASDLALGAAYENAVLMSHQLGWKVQANLLPDPTHPELIASISFHSQDFDGGDPVYAPELTDSIFSRSTSRAFGVSTPLDESDYNALTNATESIQGAKIDFITDNDAISELAQIVGECDRIMMLNENGHREFFEQHIRWDPDEPGSDGVSIASLGIEPPLSNALPLLRDPKIAAALRAIGGGSSLIESSRKAVEAGSCLALISLPKSAGEKYFRGGIAMQRTWLQAEQLGLGIQPLQRPLSLFKRLNTGEGLQEDEIDKLRDLRKLFRTITNLDEKSDEIFFFRITKSKATTVRTKRFPINEILFMANEEN
jgi:tRNA A37 threonylcarbamoyladenosine dehydratase/nitroreductase